MMADLITWCILAPIGFFVILFLLQDDER